jgi:regulatory protein
VAFYADGCFVLEDMIVGQTITALEIQEHDHERVSVYLDGEFAFGLPLIDAARLRKGQVLSDEEITALRQEDDITRTVDQIVRLLARRPYSVFEIRHHLESKRVDLLTIQEVLVRLERLGYVDDHAFARYWIENRERFKPRGPRALRYELRQKGIDESLIETVMDELDTRDSAYRAAQEQVRRLHHPKKQDFRSKVGTFLVRRGFDYEIVREVIEQLTNELEEQQPEYFAENQTDEE